MEWFEVGSVSFNRVGNLWFQLKLFQNKVKVQSPGNTPSPTLQYG